MTEIKTKTGNYIVFSVSLPKKLYLFGKKHCLNFSQILKNSLIHHSKRLKRGD